MTKVNRIAFDELISKLDLGSLIYPKYITADYILQYVRAMQNTIGAMWRRCIIFSTVGRRHWSL